MTWTIDCGHWHCPERFDSPHASSHLHGVENCAECAQERPQSERAAALTERALKIAGTNGATE